MVIKVKQAEINDIIRANIGFLVDKNLLEQAESDVNAIYQIGIKAFEAKKFEFAEKIFSIAKQKGSRKAKHYLAIISDKLRK